ncbi:MAG: NYN domain-containing protein [Ruminococcaceae bacterium]|nr:NYN domain-containing protein [Oscillospiraceae bacterium]
MGIIELFHSNKNQRTDEIDRGLPRAVAFVDYEHWYISLKNNFGMKPNIKGWFEDLKSRVTLTEAVFFADFSHKSLADEIKRIRLYSNTIIDTRNVGTNVKKDFTDFIILDHIYQKALSANDIDVFILFSGDGHFSSVVSFLKNFRGKEVGIYGIKDSFSRQLKETANWFVSLPTESDQYGMCASLIFDALKEAQLSNSKVLPTYKNITDKILSTKRVNAQRLESVLKKLISDGVITERKINLTKKDNGKPCLFVDWEKAEQFMNFDD